jgi:hypothetical protein
MASEARSLVGAPGLRSLAPDPAWTKNINGTVYTVRWAGAGIFSIWRGADKLGFFELAPAADESPAQYANLGTEARMVASTFSRLRFTGQEAAR